MTNCPTCGNALARSTGLISDAIVYRCNPCRTMAVEVDGVVPSEFIRAGLGAVEQLTRFAEKARRMREDITADTLGNEWEMMS